MEIVFELLIEFLSEVIEGFAGWGTSSKAPKWLRYTLTVMGTVFIIALTYIMMSLGMEMLNGEGFLLGWLCIGVIIFLDAVIIFYSAKKLMKKSRGKINE